MRLHLNRLSKGDYQREVGGVRITLVNPYIALGEGSKAWQLVIEVNDLEVVNEYFDTKKQASTFGAELIYTL